MQYCIHKSPLLGCLCVAAAINNVVTVTLNSDYKTSKTNPSFPTAQRQMMPSALCLARWVRLTGLTAC